MNTNEGRDLSLSSVGEKNRWWTNVGQAAVGSIRFRLEVILSSHPLLLLRSKNALTSAPFHVRHTLCTSQFIELPGDHARTKKWSG